MNKIATTVDDAGSHVETVSEFATRAIETIGTGDPLKTGITALRTAGLDPLRLWSLKAPKDAGGTVSAVFLQATSEVVILHQLASGRYVLFEKHTLDHIAGAPGSEDAR